jgi:transcriptional regulator GlxA family with amidase domain
MIASPAAACSAASAVIVGGRRKNGVTLTERRAGVGCRRQRANPHVGRRFFIELRLPPSRWLARARVRIAQHLLESTDCQIERVAAESGLGSTSNLRARFTEIVGTSPSRYRRALTVR